MIVKKVFLLIGVEKMHDRMIIDLSEMASIIAKLVFTHNYNSLLKTELTSLMVKYFMDCNTERKVNNLTRFDTVHVFFRDFSSIFFSSEKELLYINQAIYIYDKLGILGFDGDNIIKKKEISDLPLIEIMEKEEMKNTFCLIRDMSNKSFLEEVVWNV